MITSYKGTCPTCGHNHDAISPIYNMATTHLARIDELEGTLKLIAEKPSSNNYLLARQVLGLPPYDKKV